MADRDTLLAANAAFYAAFNQRDYEAMDALWATSVPVSCIHPGGGPIFDREAVMASWKGILGHDSQAPILSLGPRVRMYGDYATVICFEVIAGNNLIASNVFIREDRKWKLVHHQSGPTAEAPPRAMLSEKGPITFN